MFDPSAERGIWRKSHEERRRLAHALLDRPNRCADAEAAFRQAHPTAPDEMIRTAVHHVHNDGPDAVIDWLAEAELFLRDPSHELSAGGAFHLLYHVYNWMQFRELLPLGKPGLLELLQDLREYAEEGALDAEKERSKIWKNCWMGTGTRPTLNDPLLRSFGG